MQTETTGKTPRKASKMYGNKPPAARRLAQFPQQLADGGMVARMKSADAGPATFGSRGLSQLRDMIPKMQAMGYPQQAAAAPAAADPRAAQLQAMIPQVEAMGYKQQPQRLADGGFVSAAKRMMGLTPEDPARAARLAEYKANAEREKAAAKAASAQATAPAPQAAISQYSGMSAMQRREKEQGLADGGTVKPRGFVAGKGTGTSDSIPARLSNGEYVLPADTVKAVGVEALDSLRAATHTPVKHEQAKAAHGFFSGGTPGGLDEEKLKNSFGDAAAVARDPSVTQVGGLANNGGADASRFAQVPAPIGTQPGRTPEPAAQPAAPVPTAASTQSAGQPLDAQAASDRAKLGAAWDTVKDVNDSAGRAIADVAMLAPRAVAGAYDSAVVRPMRAAGFNAGYLSPILVPNGVDPSSMTPYADQKRMQEQAGAVAPSAPAATSSVAATASTAGGGRGSINPPVVNPDAPAPTSSQPGATQITPGVYRSGNSYSDSAQGAIDGAASRGLPTAQNLAAAEALAKRSQQESMARIGMSQYDAEVQRAKNINADEAARNNSVGARMQRLADPFSNEGRAMRNLRMDIDSSLDRNGRPTGKTEALVAQSKAMSDGYLAEPNQQRTIDAGIQREGMQQDGATARTGMQEQGASARDAGRTALARDDFGLRKEAAGFQNRAAQRMEDISGVLLDPNATPEQRSVAQRNLAALSGKTAADRMQVVNLPDTTNEMGQVVRGGQALVRTLEDGTVQQVPIGTQRGATAPLANHVAALKANPKQAAQFDEIYGPGAAARAIGK